MNMDQSRDSSRLPIRKPVTRCPVGKLLFIPNSELITRQMPKLAQILSNECWYEGQRRGHAVSPTDPNVNRNTADVILRIGGEMRKQAEIEAFSDRLFHIFRDEVWYESERRRQQVYATDPKVIEKVSHVITSQGEWLPDQTLQIVAITLINSRRL
jgi:hypothetical protein